MSSNQAILNKLDWLLHNGKSHKEDNELFLLQDNDQELVNLYKPLKQARYLNLMLECEKLSLKFTANNLKKPSTKFKQSIEDIVLIQDGLSFMMENKQIYKEAYTKSLNHKKNMDKDGLPSIDKARIGFATHIKRLEEMLEQDDMGSVNDKLAARLENIKAAEHFYKEEQKKILGV